MILQTGGKLRKFEDIEDQPDGIDDSALEKRLSRDAAGCYRRRRRVSRALRAAC